MALIGTISGSVGSGGVLTSATAVSGTLIISDSPAGSFPALPAGAKLFVAGNISGSSDFQVTGNITGSNLLLSSGFIVTGSGIIESNTSIAALRVTQLGTGDAILVEDSTNPDSSPFVVTAAGRVGIGTTAPTANLFVTGTDTTIPAFVVKSSDVTVNTFAVTSSAGAGESIGFVNIDQSNKANKYGLTISNVGTGKSGLRIAGQSGGSFSIENMNTTAIPPTLNLTHKGLWFESTSTAFDTSQTTFKFIEDGKTPTYTNQKTFLISGNNNGHKTGSYFEVQHSGTVGNQIILQLQGDAANNALFVSGSILTSGSVTIAGDLAVNGGDITTTAATFNLITGSATTVNFAQSANAINIGKLTGGAVVTISSILTGSNPTFFGDSVTIGGPTQADILTTKTTATLYNTVATTLNIGGAATTINLGVASGRTSVNGNVEISGSLIVTGSTNVGVVVENLINSVGSTGTVAFDTSKQGIFYVNGPTGGITANFTNVPTTDFKVLKPTVILSQSATPQSIAAVQIDGAPQTLNWANSTTPTATANKQDVFGFSLIRSGSAWKVLGQLSTYG